MRIVLMLMYYCVPPQQANRPAALLPCCSCEQAKGTNLLLWRFTRLAAARKSTHELHHNQLWPQSCQCFHVFVCSQLSLSYYIMQSECLITTPAMIEGGVISTACEQERAGGVRCITYRDCIKRCMK